jgi:hypothetical protein
MNDAQHHQLRAPAYARKLRSAIANGETINLHAFMGSDAWGHARRTGHTHRLVIVLDEVRRAPTDYDFTCVDDIDVTLNALDADLVLGRKVAVRMCEHGARLVVLLHPKLPKRGEFFYGART